MLRSFRADQDTVERLAWECLGIKPQKLEERAGEREVWESLLRLMLTDGN